jgi:hypothetical protein
MFAFVARADDTTFGILHSRFHELWALRMGTSLEDRPRYTPTTCFETFPFPAGLTPADTAHQRTEAVERRRADSGRPARHFARRLASREFRAKSASSARPSSASSYQNHSNPPRRHSHRPGRPAPDTLRQAWLNPPEWTQTVPEVVPLGMTDIALPRPHRAQARAFRKSRPGQKAHAHQPLQPAPRLAGAGARALDAAVAAAYGWADYTPAMPDDEILRRLLALNHADRGAPGMTQHPGRVADQKACETVSPIATSRSIWKPSGKPSRPPCPD